MFHSFSLIDWMQAIFFKKLFDCLLVLLGIRLSEDTFWDTLVKISYTVKFASVYVCLLIKRNVVHFICRLWRFMFLSNAGNVWYTSPLNITIHKKHSLSLSNKLSHMSFYTCFDWFEKLSTFSYVLNLKIDVVPKPLELFKFISDYLPYFEKN